MAYCTQADLEVAVGGAENLLQLADFNRSGDITDPGVVAVLSGWMEDEAATIRSKAEVKHSAETLANLDTPSLRKLNDANATLAARTAFEKGAVGQAMPDHLAQRAARIDKYLDDLATGMATLGRASGGGFPALNQPVGVVDYDPQGCGVSITGFKQGFR